jgi:O-antigen/teichoic acid export membrane protein
MPRRSGSMLSGAGVLVVGRYLVAALGWAGTLIVVRKLTVGEFGRFQFILALLGIIGFIADLRLSRIVLRDLMEADGDQAGHIVGSYLGLRLVIGVVSYAVAMAWVLIGNYPDDVVLGTAVAGLNLIILSGAFAIILLFEARLWLRDVAVANVLGQAVQFAMTIGIAIAGVASILWFSWSTVVNAIALTLWLVFVTGRAVRVRIHVEPSRWWVWMKEVAPLALGAALDTIYFRIDIVMLSLLDTYRAVATYSIGYKFSDLLGALPLAVVTPALTMMVAAWPNDTGAFRRTFRHAFIILAVAAIGASVGFVIYATPLVELAYTDKYPGAPDAARLLVVGQGLHFFTLLAFSTLVAVGRNRLYPIAMLLGVVVNVVLNVILIPEHSYLGSGWATVVTEAAVLVVLMWGVARIPGLLPFPWVALGKCAFAGVVAGLVGWALLDRVNWVIGGAATGLVYLAICHFLAVNGPGGLRALGGEPRDDLGAIVDEGADRPEPGMGMPG